MSKSKSITIPMELSEEAVKLAVARYASELIANEVEPGRVRLMNTGGGNFTASVEVTDLIIKTGSPLA